MDDYQKKHLEAWLDRRFSSHRRADRLRLKTGLLLLVEEDPKLLESHSWPEMACGDVSSNVEPDARNYHCDACGEDKVYGLEEAALIGAIEIDAD